MLKDNVYGYIVAYKQEHDGLSPTLREIMTGCGIPSTSVVTYQLNLLEQEGKIKRPSYNRSRNIIVVGGKWSI